MKLQRVLGVSVVALAVLISGCSSSAPPSSGLVGGSERPSGQPGSSGQITKTSEGGQVTVAVTWAGPSAGSVFEVVLDTHSVDLDALDLGDAVLRNDRGEIELSSPWTAPKGGHHRSGTLTFQGDSSSLLAGASWIEIVIKGVGDLPERTLRWDLGS